MDEMLDYRANRAIDPRNSSRKVELRTQKKPLTNRRIRIE